MGKYIDLHIHSNCSDGRLTPAEILVEARRNRLHMLSITDHDSIDSLEYLSRNLLPGITVVPGIEISTYINTRKSGKRLVHMLGYGINKDNIKLNELLNELKCSREIVNKEYIKGLQNKFPGLPDDLEENIDCTRYYVIIRTILNYLSSSNINDETLLEVKRHFRKNTPKYANYDVNAEKAIEVIIDAGGIPVLAHPMEYRVGDIGIKRMIRTLIDYGLEGIEVYHSECSLEDMKKLRMLCESYKLLYSCGSDFHFSTRRNNKVIGHGINKNLCFKSCSVANTVLQRKLFLKKERN